MTGRTKSHDYSNISHDFQCLKAIQWNIKSICYRISSCF